MVPDEEVMKQKLITATKIFMCVALAIIVIYDIIAVSLGGGAATISRIGGAGWSYQHSTIPFVWGALTGHLLWIMRGKVRWQAFRLASLLSLVGLSVFLDVADFYDVIPILPAAIGVPLGRLGWPQSWSSGHPLFIWKR